MGQIKAASKIETYDLQEMIVHLFISKRTHVKALKRCINVRKVLTFVFWRKAILKTFNCILKEIFLSLLNVVRVDEAHGVDLVFRVPAVDSRDTAAGSSRNCPRARRDSQPRLPALPTSAYLSGTHTTFVANDAAGSSPRGRWTHVPVPTGDAPYQLPQHPGGCASPPVWRSLVCSQLCTLPQFSQVSIWWRRHHTCGILNAASNFATQFPPQREAPGSDDVKLFEIILSRGKGQGDVTQYKIYFVVVSYMGSTTTVKTSAEICKSLMTWLIVEFSCLVVDHCNWTSGGRPVGGASRHGS
ncbi:hypothetical protein TNCV_117302 [Trichonephila clavipes]|nr:hypothetical protein TNCV_117302 [Trichonephila clavipes]